MKTVTGSITLEIPNDEVNPLLGSFETLDTQTNITDGLITDALPASSVYNIILMSYVWVAYGSAPDATAHEPSSSTSARLLLPPGVVDTSHRFSAVAGMKFHFVKA